jgi:hypothetical protein
MHLNDSLPTTRLMTRGRIVDGNRCPPITRKGSGRSKAVDLDARTSPRTRLETLRFRKKSDEQGASDAPPESPQACLPA